MNEGEWNGLAYEIEKLAARARDRSVGYYPELYGSKAIVPTYFYLAAAVSSEAGEMLDVAKKAIRDDWTKMLVGSRLDELTDEIADVFTYLLLLADEVGINLIHAYRIKADKVAARLATP